MKKPLILPKFKNEDEEFEFWSKLDLADYFEPSDARPISFPNLKPSSSPISIRLPNILLNKIKEAANLEGVPYQSKIKVELSRIFLGTNNPNQGATAR